MPAHVLQKLHRQISTNFKVLSQLQFQNPRDSAAHQLKIGQDATGKDAWRFLFLLLVETKALVVVATGRRMLVVVAVAAAGIGACGL